MEEACGDIAVESCQGWLTHSRLFSPALWLEKTLPVMLMKISGLTLVRDRMLTQSEQYCSVLKPCY